ncbi:MAG TPA: 6-phosphogluconolactonase, partial [Panacibacter sp.]|nr:6-phosphogluconolactonase [Panacibacter sp.]
ENIHVMPTANISPEASAKAYEQILKEYFPQALTTHHSPFTSFDLIFLGMGDDGHTLSLFPGKKDVIHETEKLCTSLWLEAQDMFRITLTHPIVNHAAQIVFLVNGSGKAEALHEVLKGNYNPDMYPSQMIKPVNGQLHWFADEAAAAGL